MIKFNQLKPVRLSGVVTGLWVVMMAAVMAAFLGGSVPAANAVTTPATSAVSVIPNATSGSALLTATRVGTGSTYQFTTAAVHVNPLPSSSEPQFVTVQWELQSAGTGATQNWTKVDFQGPGTGLYTVALDPVDGEEYIYTPLTGGKDLAPQTFKTRVISHEERAFRVVALVTWTNRSTGQVLGSVTLTPTTRSDLACQNNLANKCKVSLGQPGAGSFFKLVP